MLTLLRSRRFQAAAAVFVVGMLLYLPTLQPGIGWYNAPELVCAALTKDVPHAPGYPLFTRLAGLAIDLVPWGDPAWRVNLLSASLGAGAAALWAAWLTGWGIRRRVAVSIGVWLLAVPVFWEQSTSAEVYSLECLLFACFMLVTQSMRTGGIGTPSGLMLGLIFALGVGHRPTFAVLSAAAIFTLWDTDLRRRIGLKTVYGIACGLLIGAIPSIDLYLRLQSESRVLIDPLIGRGLEGFWRFSTGADYRAAFGVFGFDEILQRTAGWLNVVCGAGIWVPVLALAGLATGSDAHEPGRDRSVSAACLWILAVNTGFVLNYNAFEAHTMLLPSLMALGGMASVTLARAFRFPAAATGVALLLAVGIAIPVAAIRIEPRSRDSEIFTRRLAAVLPQGAVLMMNNDIEFRPFYYLRLTKKFRPDIGVCLVDALTASDAADLGPAVSRGALFGSLVYPASAAELLGSRYVVEPWGYVWRIRKPVSADRMADPPAEWHRIDIHQGNSLCIDPAIQVIPLGGTTGRTASDVVLAGDVIVYRYAVPAESKFTPFILKSELVDESGRGFQDAGVKTGHDIHFVGPLRYHASSRPDQVSLPPDIAEKYALVQRTIVIPALKPGRHLNLSIGIVDLTETSFASWVTSTVSGCNPMNRDGATELFRLRYGMGGKPLFSAGTADGIDQAQVSRAILPVVFRTGPIIP